MIIAPTILAIDSSHWAKLTKDALGADASKRRDAYRFVDSLLESGRCILLTFHHVTELLAIDDPELAADRLEFLRSIPFLSWLSLGEDAFDLGGITDILAAEALCAYGGADTAVIRQTVKEQIIRWGSGAQILPDDPLFVDFVGEWARQSADHARTITGIVPIPIMNQQITVGELLQERMRTPEDMSATLKTIHRRVAYELHERGDKRITNAAERATMFMQEVMELRQQLPNDVRQLVLAGLKMQGIDEDEITMNMTMGDLGDLGVFRQQLRVVSPKTGISFEHLKRKVQEDILPSRIVQKTLRKFAHKNSDRQGSNLTDGHLAALAPYVDVLYVDKRVAENFRVASAKAPAMRAIIGDIRKASGWRDILGG